MKQDLMLASASCSSPIPNGAYIFEENKTDAPSRAYLKLWEALVRLQKFPKAGETCLDLGSSPGGWTWVLQTLGAHVISVDKAPLAPNVEKLPNIRYVQQSAFGLAPADIGPVDWLFSDIICYPERLLRLVENWRASGLVKNMVCTIKFQGETDHAAVAEFLKSLALRRSTCIITSTKSPGSTSHNDHPYRREDMSKKLESLRAEMAKQNIDGFFVPRADEFQGEYVPASAERLKHITEFTGSAGSAVILKDKAAFFTDGRYTLQAREQVDAKDFDICSVSDDQLPTPTISPTQWIEKNLPQGGVFGIDPWVHTPSGVKSIREAVAKADGTLKYLDSNPLDASWEGRPAAPQTPAVAQPLEFSGVGSGEKRDSLAQLMRDKNIDALAVTLPEEVCWLLNVRGNDVPCTPFVLSYAILHKDGGLDWFVDDRKLSQETRDWIDAGAGHTDVHGLKEFAGTLATLAKTGAKIWVDPAASPAAATEIIETSGGAVHSERSPIQLKKSDQEQRRDRGHDQRPHPRRRGGDAVSGGHHRARCGGKAR